MSRGGDINFEGTQELKQNGSSAARDTPNASVWPALPTRTSRTDSGPVTHDLAKINKYINDTLIENEEEYLGLLIDAVNNKFESRSGGSVSFSELELQQVAIILGTSDEHIGEGKNYQISFENSKLHITSNGQKKPLIDHIREKRYRKLVVDFKASNLFDAIVKSLEGIIDIASSFEIEYLDPDFSQKVDLQRWIYGAYSNLNNGAIKRAIDDKLRRDQAAKVIQEKLSLTAKITDHYADYFYDDQDVAKVTRSLMGQDASLSESFYDGANKTIFALIAVDYFTQSYDNLSQGVVNLANNIKQVQGSVEGLKWPYKIVFPVNFGNGHWASGLIKVSEDGASLEIHDPMSPFTFTDKKRSRIVQGLLQQICGIKIDRLIETGTGQDNVKRQYDYVSCGPICAREMIMLSKGTVPAVPYPDYHPEFKIDDFNIVSERKITKSFVEQNLRFLQQNRDFQDEHDIVLLGQSMSDADPNFESFKESLSTKFHIDFNGLDQEIVNMTIKNFIRAGFTVDASEEIAGGNSDSEVQYIKQQLQDNCQDDINAFINKYSANNQVSGQTIEDEFLQAANQELKNLIFKNPANPSDARIKDYDSILKTGVIVAFRELVQEKRDSLLADIGSVNQRLSAELTSPLGGKENSTIVAAGSLPSQDASGDLESQQGFKVKDQHQPPSAPSVANEDEWLSTTDFSQPNELIELRKFLQKTSDARPSSDELVGKLIEEVDKNQNNPNPQTPYRGAGIKSQLMAQGSEDDPAYFLQIEDIFPPSGSRFTHKESENQEVVFGDIKAIKDAGMIGGKITEVFVDGSYKSVTDIVNESGTVESALQRIAAIFHNPNSVKFKVETVESDEVAAGSVIEIECDNSKNSKSIFAPDRSTGSTSDFKAISSMGDEEKLEILNGLPTSRDAPGSSPRNVTIKGVVLNATTVKAK